MDKGGKMQERGTPRGVVSWQICLPVDRRSQASECNGGRRLVLRR